MSGPSLENMDFDNAEDSLSEEIMSMSTADIQARTRLLDNEVCKLLISLFSSLCLQIIVDPYHEVRVGQTKS